MNWGQSSWVMRGLRRFGVVWIMGGVTALADELGVIPVGATPTQIMWTSLVIATLMAIEKTLRDHKDTIAAAPVVAK